MQHMYLTQSSKLFNKNGIFCDDGVEIGERGAQPPQEPHQQHTHTSLRLWAKQPAHNIFNHTFRNVERQRT